MSNDPMNGKSEDGIAQNGEGLKRRDLLLSSTSLLAASAWLGAGVTTPAQAQQPAPTSPTGQQPNIVVIMGDDIGWFNIGAYHRGIMSGKTPNLDKLASQGVMFTDYYAEASCTAGRANFITGELPIRTGMTTVGQAGADVGLPAQACTMATALKSMGYATGQFGKNHLGDLNKYLPTVHGFDEYHGYLYHLDAMSDPFWYSYPKDPAFRNHVLPAQRAPLLRDRQGRSDRSAAVGQDRQAEDRRRRPAGARPEHGTHDLRRRGETTRGRQIQHDDVRRRGGGELDRLHGQGQGRGQAVLRLAEHDARCTSGRSSRRSTKA